MKNVVTQETIDEYKTVSPLLTSMFNEIKAFALKKQDGTLSKLKVLAMNQILERTKKFLNEEPFSEFLQLLDMDTLPSNSDAVMIIANYKTAMSGFYQKHTFGDGFGGRSWNRSQESKDDDDD